jgi:hypothetical protein
LQTVPFASGFTAVAAAPTVVSHLSGSDKAWSLALIVVFVLLAGPVVIIGRRVLEGAPVRASRGAARPAGTTSSSAEPSDTTLIRSWLAISLVGGLLIFVAVSFWLDDTTLRSTLVGGVIANAGAAVAFYFASKSSDQARKDILSAALPSSLVPSLIGKDLAGAQELIAATPLRIELHPPTPAAGGQVVSQAPPANQSATSGTTVVATFAGPVPDLTGSTQEEAQSKLTAVGLQLVPDPAQPGTGTTVTAQQPQAGAASTVPADLKVHATFG